MNINEIIWQLMTLSLRRESHVLKEKNEKDIERRKDIEALDCAVSILQTLRDMNNEF